MIRCSGALSVFLELLSEMNGIDIVILGVFFISTLIGAARGFTKELLSLFSWGGSTSLSYIFLPLSQGLMHHYIANPVMAGGAGFFCTFILSLVILSIVANIIAGYIHESSFRGIDHSLGFGFGILRGVFFISAVELGLSTFWPRQSQPLSIQTARFVPMARKGGDTLLQILPGSARTWILDQAAKVESQVNSKLRDQLKAGIPNIVGESQEAQGGRSDDSGEAALLHPSAALGQYPMQGSPQGYQQPPPPVIIQSPQGEQVHSQMLVIRPSQSGQAPHLAPAPSVFPIASGRMQPPPSVGLAQSAKPQDKQSTVDALSRLMPQSSSTEESGYTQGQRDDMNRLFQAADGE